MNIAQKYTITEALQELKLLTKRINRQIDDTVFVGCKRSEDKSNIDPVSDASKHFQSIQDLIDRRSKIKSAIMQSNANTKVEIANKVYTVSEVIAHKEYINEKEQLLERMKQQYSSTQEELIRYNNDRQRKIDQLIQTTFGRDSNNNKTSIDDIKNITDTYCKQYYIELVDPLKIKEKIESLQTEIDSFKNTCDFKLSYINAITTIEI
jgi:hypothetical protein